MGSYTTQFAKAGSQELTLEERNILSVAFKKLGFVYSSSSKATMYSLKMSGGGRPDRNAFSSSVDKNLSYLGVMRRTAHSSPRAACSSAAKFSARKRRYWPPAASEVAECANAFSVSRYVDGAPPVPPNRTADHPCLRGHSLSTGSKAICFCNRSVVRMA